MSKLSPKHAEVLAIVRPHLDGATLAIVESALRSDDRLEMIRDAFLEGRDHEAVKMLRDLDPAKPRMFLPASTPMEILPTQSAQIMARPQVGPFRILRLLVSRSCAGSFDINDIVVGTRSQFAQSGDVPADAFEVDGPELDAVFDEVGERQVSLAVTEKEARFGIPIDLTVDTAVDVRLVVTNVGDQPLRFRAAWVGEVDYAAPRQQGLVL